MTVKKQDPVEVIDTGEVRTSIYPKRTPDGYLYHTFELSRMHGSKPQKSFHDSTVPHIIQASQAAAKWIRDQAK